MDYKEILNLMKEMNNTDLTKLELEENGIKITLEKAMQEGVAVLQSMDNAFEICGKLKAEGV